MKSFIISWKFQVSKIFDCLKNIMRKTTCWWSFLFFLMVVLTCFIFYSFRCTLFLWKFVRKKNHPGKYFSKNLFRKIFEIKNRVESDSFSDFLCKNLIKIQTFVDKNNNKDVYYLKIRWRLNIYLEGKITVQKGKSTNCRCKYNSNVERPLMYF